MRAGADVVYRGDVGALLQGGLVPGCLGWVWGGGAGTYTEADAWQERAERRLPRQLLRDRRRGEERRRVEERVVLPRYRAGKGGAQGEDAEFGAEGEAPPDAVFGGDEVREAPADEGEAHEGGRVGEGEGEEDVHEDFVGEGGERARGRGHALDGGRGGGDGEVGEGGD